jgi:SAM-dependent methyltransferase
MPVIEHPPNFRTAFDEVAVEYDAMRPGYPTALIDDVVAFAALPADGHILEIGCGTGQATLPFAQRGYQMTCLDMGSALAALAAEKCRAYPKVVIQVSTFEAWAATSHSFDLVISATAFHWIAPEVGYPKVAHVLKNGGALAIFSNEHPPATSGFFVDVEQVYQRVLSEQGRDPQVLPTIQSSIERTVALIDASELFTPVIVKTYPWTTTYTTNEYLGLLNTYSPNRNLSAQQRDQLFQGIADLIEGKYGGVITKPYLSVLYLTKKQALSA